MSTLELKELSHPAGEVIKIASGKTLDLKTQGSVTMPTGSVLQVVNATLTTAISTTSTTFVDVLTASITPTSASSKILVNISTMLGHDGGSGAFVGLLRDTTNLISNTAGGVSDTKNAWSTHTADHSNSPNREVSHPSITYLDSPATASSITYKLQYVAAGGTVYVNRWALNTDHAGVTTITLMEIQG